MGRRRGIRGVAGAVVLSAVGAASDYVIQRESEKGLDKKKPEEEEEKETLGGFLFKAMKSTVKDNIPIEAVKDLRPKFYMYIFGLLSLASMMALFLYYMYTVFNREMAQRKLTFDDGIGECDAVITPVTGYFTADPSGNWIGMDNYSYSQGKYELALDGAEFTTYSYSSVMSLIQESLQKTAVIGQQLDFAGNLALMISWQWSCNKTVTPAICEAFLGQSFVFTTSAEVN